MAELGLALRARLALADAEKGHYPFRNYRHARARRVLFVGCNVVSLYPRTVRAAVRVLAEREGMGYALDCCGAPLALAGKRTQAQRAAEGVVRRLSERGVEEAAFACPTCERSLRAPLAAAGIRSTSVYAALRRAARRRRRRVPAVPRSAREGVAGRGALLLRRAARGARGGAVLRAGRRRRAEQPRPRAGDGRRLPCAGARGGFGAALRLLRFMCGDLLRKRRAGRALRALRAFGRA